MKIACLKRKQLPEAEASGEEKKCEQVKTNEVYSQVQH
jgi:hypothetical protein